MVYTVNLVLELWLGFGINLQYIRSTSAFDRAKGTAAERLQAVIVSSYLWREMARAKHNAWSLPEARSPGSSWPPRQPGGALQPPREVSSSRTATDHGQWLCVRCDATISPLRSSSESSPSLPGARNCPGLTTYVRFQSCAVRLPSEASETYLVGICENTKPVRLPFQEGHRHAKGRSVGERAQVASELKRWFLIISIS